MSGPKPDTRSVTCRGDRMVVAMLPSASDSPYCPLLLFFLERVVNTFVIPSN